jgi:pyruvate/2-oxoglutarate dehydrogenase complex dihydrolipoamide acyltransferase (E2) component
MINVIGEKSVPTYMFVDVDASWMENLRQKYSKRGLKITATAILLKAIAIAQRTHPMSRTTALPWGRTAVLHDIVAGFTVERFVESHPAVFFGAIEKPDSKPLEEIAKELKEYGQAPMKDIEQLDVQNRFNNMPWLFRRFILWLGMRYPAVRLRYMGATVGISSLGKLGIKGLIPPCVSTSTFGVGAVEERPVVKDGKIEIRPMFTLILNFDHNLIDGAPAARFLNDIIALLEGGLEQHIDVDQKVGELSPSYS